jgi:hypothetical protein
VSSINDFRISIGKVDTVTFPQSESLGVQTAVAPTVVCGGYQSAAGYDCIAIYVDIADSDHYLKIRRFWSSYDAALFRYRLHLQYGDEGIGQIKTSADPAAWHDGERYWVVAQKLEKPQYIVVYSSADTLTWDFEDSFYQDAIAPTAASYYNGDFNTLFRFRH